MVDVKEELEAVLQRILKAIQDDRPEIGWGLTTKRICTITGLPWPVVKGCLTQLKVEGFVEPKPAWSDCGMIVGDLLVSDRQGRV